MRSQAIFWKMRGSPAHHGPGQQNPAARAASWTAASHRREAAAPGCPRCWSGGTCPAWDCFRRCYCRHAAARLLLTRGMTCLPKLTAYAPYTENENQNRDRMHQQHLQRAELFLLKRSEQRAGCMPAATHSAEQRPCHYAAWCSCRQALYFLSTLSSRRHEVGWQQLPALTGRLLRHGRLEDAGGAGAARKSAKLAGNGLDHLAARHPQG